jgi:hypothetical protein
MIAIVLVSVTAFGIFSFAARTNSTGTHHTTTRTASSSSPPAHSFAPQSTTTKIPSQITTNPVAHNTTLKGSSTDPCITYSGDTKLYWNHVYDSKRLDTKNECVTVEGTVYSKPGGGTVEDEDGDLHFTLTLDPQYTKYSNKYDCSPSDPDYKQCQSHPDKIVVEVICHKEPSQSYNTKWNYYCKGVDPKRVPLANTMPAQGEHLSVSGRWVQDMGDPRWEPPPNTPPGTHDPWMEIHPAIDVHKT